MRRASETPVRRTIRHVTILQRDRTGSGSRVGAEGSGVLVKPASYTLNKNISVSGWENISVISECTTCRKAIKIFFFWPVFQNNAGTTSDLFSQSTSHVQTADPLYTLCPCCETMLGLNARTNAPSKYARSEDKTDWIQSEYFLLLRLENLVKARL